MALDRGRAAVRPLTMCTQHHVRKRLQVGYFVGTDGATWPLTHSFRKSAGGPHVLPSIGGRHLGEELGVTNRIAIALIPSMMEMSTPSETIVDTAGARPHIPPARLIGMRTKGVDGTGRAPP